MWKIVWLRWWKATLWTLTSCSNQMHKRWVRTKVSHTSKNSVCTPLTFRPDMCADMFHQSQTWLRSKKKGGDGKTRWKRRPEYNETLFVCKVINKCESWVIVMWSRQQPVKLKRSIHKLSMEERWSTGFSLVQSSCCILNLRSF